jgi:hypothetical protein
MRDSYSGGRLSQYTFDREWRRADSMEEHNTLVWHSPIVGEALDRIKGMFAEMPGTEWTATDAARLSGLEGGVCRAALGALRDTGYLRQRMDGVYVRSQILPAAG